MIYVFTLFLAGAKSWFEKFDRKVKFYCHNDFGFSCRILCFIVIVSWPLLLIQMARLDGSRYLDLFLPNTDSRVYWGFSHLRLVRSDTIYCVLDSAWNQINGWPHRPLIMLSTMTPVDSIATSTCCGDWSRAGVALTNSDIMSNSPIECCNGTMMHYMN